MTGEYILPFGKYKGKALKDVPNSWLEFMYFHNKLTGELKKYAEENVPIIRFHVDKRSNNGNDIGK